MGGSWYYRRSGQQAGPLPFEQLQQLASTGELSPDDEVRSGHGYWQPARSVDELWTEPALASGNGTEQRAESSSGGVVLDMSELDDLDAVSAPSESSFSPSVDERQFFCRKSGERDEIGPLALSVLQTEADEGRLTPNDRIREEGSLCWIPCRELDALSFPETDPETAEGAAAEPAGESWRSEPAVAEQAVETDGGDTGEEAGWEDVLYAPQEDDVTEATPAPVPEPARDDRAEDRPVRNEPVPETPSTRAAATLASLVAEAEVSETPTRSRSKRSQRSSRGFQVHQMNSSLLYILGALLVVLVLVKLWPSDTGFHGEVLVDGNPLPVGSLTFTQKGGNPREGLNLGVVDGRFEASEQAELEPGSYDVVVTIGSPLGFPTAKLEGTAVSDLNGAKLRTMIEVQADSSDPILMDLASAEAVLLEQSDTSAIGIE